MSTFIETTHQSKGVRHSIVEGKFEISPRMQKLIEYSQSLSISGKRNLYTANEEQLMYHWTDKCNAILPQSGDWGFDRSEGMALGDHGIRIDLGIDFPKLNEVPSHVEEYRMDGLSWGKDYAFLLDNHPIEIHPNELITGECHWEMNEIRKYDFGDEVFELAHKARELGAGGTSHGHTCSDLGIGIKEGWGGILERIEKSLALYTRLNQKNRMTYLQGLKLVCESIIRYIKRYSDRAFELASEETDPEQKARYEKIGENCAYIATNPPATFHQAIQWIQFAVMTDRMVGHGNGYGRIDLYLNDLYENDLKENRITRDEAREYLAEMFLKLRGQFFALGGRLRDGSDATNTASWLVMEAYDMVDDYNNLGVMWHEDMDPDFYAYVCDILARHGSGIPSLVNYDLIKDAELRSGIPEDIAWTVAYSGCQWFCIPGREYCDQDVNALIMLNPFWRALDRGIDEKFDTFEQLYDCVFDEFKKTVEAERVFKDKQLDMLPKVWPEMATSLNCHGPIERGMDMTDARGVDVQNTSCNILAIPNVVDSLFAIKKLVFEEKMYTLQEVKDAVESDWEGKEAMRLRFLNQHKYGNDFEDVDSLMCRFADDIADIMDNVRNNRGQEYRASMFHFMGHSCMDILPATPDGRKAHTSLAHGYNPTPGMNTNGLIATANSVAKINNYKFQGGSLQVELQPKFFDGKENRWEYIKNFSETFFRDGGTQINLNIMDLNALEDAIEHPDDPQYQNIIIKVTGYTSRFVSLNKSFQTEFVGRCNYEGM